MKEIFDYLLKNPTLPVVTITAIVAFFSFMSQRHLARSKNSIEFEENYHSENTEQIATTARIALHKLNSNELAELAKQENFTTENAKAIRELLNIWERVSIAVQYKIYDEDVLFNAYAAGLIWVWEHSQPYISEKRKINPRLYINVDWLAIRWLIKRNNLKKENGLKNLQQAIKLIEKYNKM